MTPPSASEKVEAGRESRPRGVDKSEFAILVASGEIQTAISHHDPQARNYPDIRSKTHVLEDHRCEYPNIFPLRYIQRLTCRKEGNIVNRMTMQVEFYTSNPLEEVDLNEFEMKLCGNIPELGNWHIHDGRCADHMIPSKHGQQASTDVHLEAEREAALHANSTVFVWRLQLSEDQIKSLEYKYILIHRHTRSRGDLKVSDRSASHALPRHKSSGIQLETAFSEDEKDIMNRKHHIWWPEYENLNINHLKYEESEIAKINDAPLVVNFKMYFSLPSSESLAITGSIHGLGHWNTLKVFRLHRSHDNESRWTGKLMLVKRELDNADFELKYVIIKHGRHAEFVYEQGENRRMNISCELAKHKSPHDDVVLGVREECMIYNAWEATMVRLIMFHPMPSNMVLGVIGSLPTLGNWKSPVRMGMGLPRLTMTQQIDRCWELTFPMRSSDFEANPNIAYRYVQLESGKEIAIWEREPNRNLLPPDASRPLVNGMYDVFDGNFVTEMDIDRIHPNMFLGPYPQTPADVDRIRALGATAVLNVQTDHDFKQRQVDWASLSSYYSQLQMPCLRHPIYDFDPTSLDKELSGAVSKLKYLIQDERHVVYIHCTAGMGRAPAAAIGYLCKHENMNPHDALHKIKQVRPKVGPNMSVIEKLYRNNQL